MPDSSYTTNVRMTESPVRELFIDDNIQIEDLNNENLANHIKFQIESLGS